MATILPKEINYTPAASLPEGTQCTSIVSSPVNGQSFGASSIIQFDLVQRGYLIPESMYIRFKLTCNGGAAVGINWLRGTPVYSLFQRLETIVGSQVVESIQNYNQLSNMLVNTKLNYSQKIGLSNCFGYSSLTQGQALFDFNLNAANGLSLSTTTAAAPFNGFFAGPLGCILSNADHLVPLGYMPSARIQLSLESIANAFSLSSTPANQILSYALSNVELCYDVVQFNPMVDQAISARSGGMLTIKSQSYLSSGVTLPSGSIGSLEFLFNQRLASIKSLFTHLSGSVSSVATNQFFDSVDCTGAAGGDYQWFVSGTPYPARPISTVLNKAAASMELSLSWGPASDILSSNFSILPAEFNAGNTTATTQCVMGKFYLGTNVEKLSTNSALLTGISSQGSPISFRVSIGTATTNTQVIQLICLYDALLQIDMGARTLVVLQ